MGNKAATPDLSSGFALLGRNYCHLCHDMEAALEPLLAPLGLPVQTVDVDQFPELEERWGELVPVLLHEGQEVCHYFLDPAAVGAVLAKIR
ncbi:glutaredoxin family protein [Azospira inquinata]|uniref:Glutaredoxin family protein n=1 Tax=Azospira inquinata TaxID=2785627 RepID=A0A975SN87_9RHOO|nr:glutaredoxin family protein [Azospira inquinata]QWT45696.1 glutaredoxin family protein [Azospira inquinata]QWT48980.1 glutaredoxin family protein [Azospira inquinata]